MATLPDALDPEASSGVQLAEVVRAIALATELYRCFV
jgi:hypothetical protein